MNKKIVPLHLNGIHNDIYAGFLPRLGSLMLDFVFAAPVIFLLLYINSMSMNMYFYTAVPNLLFVLWYNIYVPKRYGGTFGKLVTGIKIIRLDGEPIGWKEAFMRHVVLLALTLFSIIIMIYCVLQADKTTFNSYSWLQQTNYLMTFAPVSFIISAWLNNVWIYSEFIVLLLNERKRAVHDYIAGTVIVKAIYIDKIRAAMQEEEAV